MISESTIIHKLQQCDADATKRYFYEYCRHAYNIYDRRYQLSSKVGLDFYSLAHEYYIHLLKYDFRPLLDKPAAVRLSTWLTRGFHFVVLDALKAYNREFDAVTLTDSDVIIDHLRSTDKEEGMMRQVADAVAAHYGDGLMTDIARLTLVEGYRQNEVARMLSVTPSAVNQRVRRLMDEVVTPFVIENYGRGIYRGAAPAMSRSECMCEERIMYRTADVRPTEILDFDMVESDCITISDKYTTMKNRTTPEVITSLAQDEIFVFGSNLQGLHHGGAARAARMLFGAVMGQGVGMQGQSYAIPTMQGGVETIRPYVDEFIEYAADHPELRFLVTPIGCGIAGFEPRDIAPLFAEAVDIENISLPKSFWSLL